MDDRDFLIASIHSKELREKLSDKYCDDSSTFLDYEFLHPFEEYTQSQEDETDNEIKLDFLKSKRHTLEAPKDESSWHIMPDRDPSDQDLMEWTAIQLRSFASNNKFYKTSYGKLKKLPKKYQVGVIGNSRKSKSIVSPKSLRSLI